MKVIKTITETSIIKEMAHRLSMPIFWFADKNIKTYKWEADDNDNIFVEIVCLLPNIKESVKVSITTEKKKFVFIGSVVSGNYEAKESMVIIENAIKDSNHQEYLRLTSDSIYFKEIRVNNKR